MKTECFLPLKMGVGGIIGGEGVVRQGSETPTPRPTTPPGAAILALFGGDKDMGRKHYKMGKSY